MFVETRDHAILLTSDHPFTSAPSIGASGALHYFPFSPQRGVVFCRDKAKVEFLKKLGFNGAVSYLNLLTVLFAHQYVYSNSRRDEEIVLEHLGGAYRYTREQFTATLLKASNGTLSLGLSN